MASRRFLWWLTAASVLVWYGENIQAADANVGPADTVIERDWRMQDGIGTQRMPETYATSIQRTLRRGDRLIDDLQGGGVKLGLLVDRWEALRSRCHELAAAGAADNRAWEDLWRQIHRLRRQIVLANPLAQTGPLVFVKRVPSAFSHQLTQYYGRDARPGGGLFVLEKPGESFACRQLAGSLPMGSYLHPEVSSDGRRILFAYCQVEAAPPNRDAHGDVFYHLYEVDVDGSGLRQLTDGPYDDFSPLSCPTARSCSSRRAGADSTAAAAARARSTRWRWPSPTAPIRGRFPTTKRTNGTRPCSTTAA